MLIIKTSPSFFLTSVAVIYSIQLCCFQKMMTFPHNLFHFLFLQEQEHWCWSTWKVLSWVTYLPSQLRWQRNPPAIGRPWFDSGWEIPQRRDRPPTAVFVGFLIAQVVKNPPAIRGDRIRHQVGRSSSPWKGIAATADDYHKLIP